MNAQLHLPTPNLQQIVEQIFTVRRISRTDQQHLMAIALAKQTLTPEERTLIDRVFDALHRGILRVAD